MDQPTTRPIRVELDLNGKPCELEVDTRAEARVNRILPGAQLMQTNVSLRTYTSEIPVKGRLRVQVRYGQQEKLLTCYVV